MLVLLWRWWWRFSTEKVAKHVALNCESVLQAVRQGLDTIGGDW